jgi:hypothetical protein
MKFQPIAKINNKRIAYQFSNGALVTTPAHFALKARCIRLKNLLRSA